ncbi:MAG: MCE family protein [Acidimicrobiales bacterium]
MLVNLVAFLVISGSLIGYGIFDLLGNPFQHPTVVSATFPSAAGVQPNFGVVLKGVVVGSVSGIQLTPGGAEVRIALRQGVKVPANVVASIGLANDLGEQQIELTPRGKPSTRSLQEGAKLPVARGGIPTQVGRVIGTASRLLRSIGAKQLNSLLSTLSQSLQGQAQNLQTIMTSSQQFSAEFLTYQHQFESLLANSTPVLNGLANDGAQLRQDLASTEVLANVLDQHRYNLVQMLANGASASSIATKLLAATRPNLACILYDFANLSANGAEPQNISNLSVGLATNSWFFGAVAGITPTGPAKSMFPGDPYNAHQGWFRTRLYIPPGSPPAAQYPKPTRLNTVMPGAGCSTEFGQGVGRATQSAAQFPVVGTRYDLPTPAEARVRGGADPTSARTSAARFGRPAGSPDYTLTADRVPASPPKGLYGWLALGLAVPFALALLVPRRRRYVRAVVEVRSPRRRSLPDRKERP